MKFFLRSTFTFIVALFHLATYAQIEKGDFQIGFSGAPLIETNSQELSGGLLTLNTDYFLTNRISVGLAPYYGFTRDVGHYGYNLITMEPVGKKKRSYDSFGLNIEAKYFILKSNAIKPYATVMGGVGKTLFRFYSETVGRSRVYENEINYNTFNLGVGLGAQIKLATKLYLDTKVMYSRIASFDDALQTGFVYPSVGIIKSF